LASLVSWFQAIGNVAVIGGLIFVGLQMQQDRELKRAELAFSAFETVISQQVALAGENPAPAVARALNGVGDLTTEEAIQLEALMWLDMINWQRNALMDELGVFEGRWRKGLALSYFLYESPVGMAWLDQNIDAQAPELRALLTKARTDLKTGNSSYAHLISKMKTAHAEPTTEKDS
jgi:type II secretory pathway pseudopilin PulG